MRASPLVPIVSRDTSNSNNKNKNKNKDKDNATGYESNDSEWCSSDDDNDCVSSDWSDTTEKANTASRGSGGRIHIISSSPQSSSSSSSSSPCCAVGAASCGNDSVAGAVNVSGGRKRARRELPAGLTLPDILAQIVADIKSKKSEIPQLSRATLLKLTSPEMQLYSKEIAKCKTLTKEEKLLLKKQKRLVKNRESAQMSRQKKRDHVEYLEGVIKGIEEELEKTKNERDFYRNENINLKSENNSIREYVSYIFNEIRQCGASLSSEAIALGNKLGLTSFHFEPVQTFSQEGINMENFENNSVPVESSDLHLFSAPTFFDSAPVVSSLSFGQGEGISLSPIDGSDAYSSDSSMNSPSSPFGANWRAAGTSLMIVVLLFGLFNVNGNQNSQSAVLTATGPMVQNVPTSRVLHSHEADYSAIAKVDHGWDSSALVVRNGQSRVLSEFSQFDDFNMKRASMVRKYLSNGDNTTYLFVNDVTTLDPVNRNENDKCSVGVVVPFAALNSSTMKLDNIKAGPNDLLEFTCLLDINSAHVIDVSKIQQSYEFGLLSQA
eukprot:TRINITY_DN3399_c0_g1_i1.p1 TRINITY_DN3399_c0_g1~~TRINITY_DN3399_c0_g1_i1.p1  ORF type:complete len:563 (+),score=119.61 TRINITY_DN3399_c0_g1_i1:37-1689(+)